MAKGEIFLKGPVRSRAFPRPAGAQQRRAQARDHNTLQGAERDAWGACSWGALRWLVSSPAFFPFSDYGTHRFQRKGHGGLTGNLRARSSPQDHSVWLRTILLCQTAPSMRGEFVCTVRVRSCTWRTPFGLCMLPARLNILPTSLNRVVLLYSTGQRTAPQYLLEQRAWKYSQP